MKRILFGLLAAFIPFSAFAQFPVVVGPGQSFQGVEGNAASSTGPIPVISASVATSSLTPGNPGQAAAAGSASSVNAAGSVGTHTPTTTGVVTGSSSLTANQSAGAASGVDAWGASLNVSTGAAAADGTYLQETWAILP